MFNISTITTCHSFELVLSDHNIVLLYNHRQSKICNYGIHIHSLSIWQYF